MKISIPGLKSPLPVLAVAFLLAGAVLPLAISSEGGPDSWRERVWLLGLIVTGLPVAWKTLKGMLEGKFAADVVAMLAILGALLLQLPLAGLVVVLMQTGGEALEDYAVARASNAVEALEADAPRSAHRVDGEHITEIEAGEVVPGDVLLIRPGELVPADGVVVDGRSHVDTSRLTGEPLPLRVGVGSEIQSGSLNQDGALRLRALKPASESEYARIVELVRSAQASKSPLQRTADRWAIWFTPLTLALCAVAFLISHDWTRVLAVLVVATPCPLILAAPVAIIGGINRAARQSIIMRNGGALEGLAKVNTMVFDKTGTLTLGTPAVARIRTSPGSDKLDILSRIAAVEQGSSHLLARVLVKEAERHGAAPRSARELLEEAGEGVRGVVDGITVVVGSAHYVRSVLAVQAPDTLPTTEDMSFSAEAALAATTALDELEHERSGHDGLAAWAVMSDGSAARIDFVEELRPELATMFAQLRSLGLDDAQLLSGDKESNVASIAREVGIHTWAGGLSAADKVARIAALEQSGRRVLMVGDGTNDAPALSRATVGIALAGHGGGVVAQAADVVLLIDNPLAIPEALRTGRRAMKIARQSIAVGLGLSFVGMLFATAGMLPPVMGALVQEGIDVAVILNALRAAGPDH